MALVPRGQYEANQSFTLELFCKTTLFLDRYSYDCETYRVCIIEDGEHFGEVELRLTPWLRREMRLTVIFQCILSRLTPMIVDYSFVV